MKLSIFSLIKNIFTKKSEDIKSIIKKKLVSIFQNSFKAFINDPNIPKEIASKIRGKLNIADLRDPNVLGFWLDSLNVDEIGEKLLAKFMVDQGISEDAFKDGESVIKIVEPKLKDYEDNFLLRPSSMQIILDYLDPYIKFVLEAKQSSEPKQIEQKERPRILIEELKAAINLISKEILNKFDIYIRNPDNKALQRLDPYFINILRFNLESLIATDLNPHTGLIGKTIMDLIETATTEEISKDTAFIDDIATKLFDEHYKHAIITEGMKIINLASSPENVNEILSGQAIRSIQDQFEKISKTAIDPEVDYFYNIHEDIYFTESGKQLFLRIWADNLTSNAEIIANLFIAQVRAAGAPQHKEVSDHDSFLNNLNALAEDMQLLMRINQTHKAFFGNQSLPLLEFLIQRNLGAHTNYNKFDIEAPGLSGRNTSILKALERMANRGLFFPMAPDLKSEKWTLTINPIPNFKKLVEVYAGNLASAMRDVLTAFVVVKAQDSPFFERIKELIKAFDRYVIAHFDEKNLQTIIEEAGSAATKAVENALNKASQQLIPAKAEAAGNVETTAKPSTEGTPPKPAYTIHTFFKQASDKEASGLVSAILKRFHGTPLDNSLSVEVTEYSSPEFPYKVYNFQIHNVYLRRLNPADFSNLFDILQGNNLDLYQTVGQNKFVVKANYQLVGRVPTYNIAVAVPNKEYDENKPMSNFTKAVISGIDFSTVSDSQAVDYAREILPPEEVYSRPSSHLKDKLNELKISHYVQDHYNFDFPLERNIQKGSREDKLTKDILKVMEAMRIKFGLDSNTEFPTELSSAMLDTLTKFESIAQEFPAVLGHSVGLELNNLKSLADNMFSGNSTLGDVAMLHDSFINFKNKIDKTIEQVGATKPALVKDVQRAILDLSHELLSYFEKNPRLDAMISFGRLENILEDLEQNPKKYKDYTNINNLIEETKKRLGLRFHKLEDLPSPEVLNEALTALEGKYVPIQDEEIKEESKVVDEIKNPELLKSISAILPLGKNFEKLKSLLITDAQNLKLDLKDNDVHLKEFFSLFTKVEPYSIPVKIHSEIVPDKKEFPSKARPILPKEEESATSETVLSWLDKAKKLFGSKADLLETLFEIQKMFEANVLTAQDVKDKLIRMVVSLGYANPNNIHSSRIIRYIFGKDELERPEELLKPVSTVIPMLSKLKLLIDKSFDEKKQDILTKRKDLSPQDQQSILAELDKQKKEFEIALDTIYDRYNVNIEQTRSVEEKVEVENEIKKELETLETKISNFLETI